MKVLLTNFFRAADVRIFDPSTVDLVSTNDYTWEDTDGVFAYQDEALFCLYCCEEVIHLFLDGIQTTLNSNLRTQNIERLGQRYFDVSMNGVQLYTKTYPPKPQTDGNPFWPSDAEDEDILLWIHHIATSVERQQMLLSQQRNRKSPRK